MTQQMKKPQLEDGFTRIANELFEAILGFGFSQRQLLVLLTILRKTYGFGKKEDDMSASQIGKVCNIDRNHVTLVIGQLAKMNVISKRQGQFGLVLGVNKNYREWAPEEGKGSTKSVLVPNRDSTNSVLALVVPIKDSPSTESVQVGSTESVHTKENLPKENQQKKERSEKPPRSPRQDCCFADWIEQCKQEGVQAITEDDTIFDYADEVGLPIDLIRLAWVEFKRKYTTGAGKSKKYKDWRAHFRNAVRENWYGIWFEKDNVWQLTTRGKQLQKEMRGKE